jgi:hypothetical protein
MTASPTESLLTPQAAVERLEEILAHAWMVRTFLKHAPEIQDNPEMRAVPRTLFDSIRAVEPARQRGDYATYLRRLQGKLPKLRQITDFFAQHYTEFSTHTNYAMAALSLRGIIRVIEEILQRLDWDAVRQLPSIPASPSLSAPPPVSPSPSAPAPVSPSPSAQSHAPPDPLDALDIPEV